jgi:hypothetical protein
MITENNELELNILALNYMAEDYGHLVDVAIDAIVETCETLKTTDYELALKLSQIFAKEDFWERTKSYAYQNYLEVLAENDL